MKKIILATLLASFCIYSFAQEAQKKPDCKKPKESCSIKDKKACSPGDTKTSEAKVLTDLREELAEVSISLGYTEEIKLGKDDDESLQILISRTNKLLSEAGLAELTPSASKARNVAEIRNKIGKLRKQIR